MVCSYCKEDPNGLEHGYWRESFQDGLDGARALAEAGAPVLVQDEATSTVWGMPGSIAKAGLAEAILPIGQIPAAIAALLLRRATIAGPR